MERKLFVYNSLSRTKEEFKPINEGKVGMYVCGPTVYSDVHLGNCLTFVRFDVIYRILLHLGYKVRYVRNITDVGHLLDDGEDRISKGARIDQLEPMEVVQKYANGFHDMMDIFNAKRPNIEPRATGHIIEQIEMVQQIIDNGYGYEVNGSVYFDTIKFAEETGQYGKLSGRVIDELQSETRDLKNQSEKKNPSDFAIWMNASPEHLMRWNSPWGEGFPGWHLECSAMSTKYLGKTFDIHGGGNDLKFPHHENEVAQNVGACGCAPANYWLHTNMLLMNGKKMSKSDGNTISPSELFSGDSPHVSKGFHPMVIRFFMLQSHYRSELNLTDEGILAAEKGYKRIMECLKAVDKLNGKSDVETALDQEINALLDQAVEDLLDDFNTPKALSRYFELCNKINGLKEGTLNLSEVSQSTIERLQKTFPEFIFEVLGLKDAAEEESGDVLDGVMQLVIDLRQGARDEKNWGVSDKIRDDLAALDIQIKDGKDGTEWGFKS
ncbi:cysteine--tRNA ligase [Portibacter marinus]|uniref:cysteine--tRNA ligase n=1 Tax=Portibacter marinus TaxID=2898660 RepID=UPI001EFF74BA|nr:cysteine--tRNA ligase [Portibacter marinus]